jgi:flagellar biosynthesis protein FlhF
VRSDAKIKSGSDSAARESARESVRDGAPAQPLKLKTYQAWTMAEALSFVKEDLGADAVILHTRTFERGGFFGFGRKAVVEITAARAADMPRSEPKRPAARSATTGAVGSVAAGALGASRTAEHVGETVQLSAAARAYAAGGGAAAARSSSATGHGIGSMAGLTGSGSTANAGTTRVSADAGLDRNEAVLDMDAEREKTRRLAQAMAIQLEKQTTERANAARNERATGVAAREQQRGGGGVAGISPLATPAASVVTTDPPGPAQRFVLVPEVRSAGTASSAASGFTAVCTPVTAVAPGASAPAKPAQPVVAQPAVAQPVVVSAAPVVAAAPVLPAAPVVPAVPAAPVALSAAPASAAPVSSHSELDTISAFVGRVLSARGGVAEPDTRAVTPAIARQTRAAEAVTTPRTASLEQAYARLIEQEVARDLADRILADVERELSASADAGSTPTEAGVRQAIERRLAALLPEDGTDPFRILPGRNGHARRIAFVGPTGVGKTTTLAKFAAQLSLKRGLRVGIVAADTYRIAAVDQLRTYAEILNLPVAVANSPADAARACDSLGDVDVILIDTAGRSQNDRMKLAELRAFLAAAAPDETHLVLSATAGARTLSREAESFGALGIDRLVLTKLDEAASFGTLVSLIERIGKRVSFFTNGQEVPDHMEVARGRRLATLVMGDVMGETVDASGTNAAEIACGVGIQAGSGVR